MADPTTYKIRPLSRDEIVELIDSLRPFVDFMNTAESAYRKRGGNPDAYPDTHPFVPVAAHTIRKGSWRRLRNAHRLLTSILEATTDARAAIRRTRDTFGVLGLGGGNV